MDNSSFHIVCMQGWCSLPPVIWVGAVCSGGDHLAAVAGSAWCCAAPAAGIFASPLEYNTTLSMHACDCIMQGAMPRSCN